MPIRPQDLIKILEKQGWRLLRKGKGSHMVYTNGKKNVTVPVHKGKDMAKGTVKSIEKETGVKILKK